MAKMTRTPLDALRGYEFPAATHGDRQSLKLTAESALAIIPDGWAKVDGKWVQASRCYLGGDTERPTNQWVVIGPEVE